jgi:hypothetical protein
MANGEVAYFLNFSSITTATQKRQKAQSWMVRGLVAEPRPMQVLMQGYRTQSNLRDVEQCCQNFLQTTLHQSFDRGEQVHNILIVKHKK